MLSDYENDDLQGIGEKIRIILINETIEIRKRANGMYKNTIYVFPNCE